MPLPSDEPPGDEAYEYAADECGREHADLTAGPDADRARIIAIAVHLRSAARALADASAKGTQRADFPTREVVAELEGVAASISATLFGAGGQTQYAPAGRALRWSDAASSARVLNTDLARLRSALESDRDS